MEKNIKIFCVTNKRIPYLENSKLILAGVGKENFSNKYLKSNYGNNIEYKEKFYSELVFHYWYWKNVLYKEEQNSWIGFSQKRRFWIKSSSEKVKINSNNLIDNILLYPEQDWSNYDSIICKPITVSGSKKMKIIKRGWRNLIKQPSILFDNKKQTIEFHFDLSHGYKNLHNAINLMDEPDKSEFKNYVSTKNYFNPNIMFIARPDVIEKWFLKLFIWLEKCEKIFPFESLKGYDTGRIFAYLAERYLSFWFKKYTNYKEHPWTFVDN